MLSLGAQICLEGNAFNMQQQMTTGSNPFGGDRVQVGFDVEFGSDPASGAFFQTDGRKYEDLKQMLDSNKDGLKLEAMKRIISMIARGRDASDLFPAVVKNVVSKNIEVKKLVYVYLVRYAEEQQDLALLSISTFQRALKDPNQLIRASALRVLSSIRVSMIVPIVMLAIRDSVADMSPYVRKTAAHAIPKLYSLDPEQKDELVMVIDKLLSDRTTLVVGSAVMAFDEVCPERVDLIHKNYRKLCNLLVDVDEWGQVIIINMLTRYARTQFVDPNADDSIEDDNGEGYADGKENFYDEISTSSESDSEKHSKNKSNNNSNTKGRKRHTDSYHINVDHRLLLRQTKPLLQSRNASVVMAVAQLYHHIAPHNEVQMVAKSLVRLLRSHKEVQSVVLTCIATISTKRKNIFEAHIKSFFVLTSDPTHIKLLKLDILTNLASPSSIPLILREFQTYISSSDRSFVAATIQAIGRCAASIKSVTETCLSGLVQLLSNKDEHVVAESVVVIMKLLQTKSAEHFDIIIQMAKLLDFITVPAARASIIWLIGEYNEKVSKIAPDVLRKMAKSFVEEENVVKVQILNLGVKLFLSNPQQTSLLCQYVFTLARYDPNYDIRDRARFLRQIIFPASGNATILSRNARKIFLAGKPAPAIENKHKERNCYQLASLSHYLNMHAFGYTDLPKFPATAPDSSVRIVEGFSPDKNSDRDGGGGGDGAKSGVMKQLQKHSIDHDSMDKSKKGFLSESDKSSAYSNSESSSGSSGSESSSEASWSSGHEKSKSKKNNAEAKKVEKKKERQTPAKSNDVEKSGTSDSETSSSESSGSESDNASDSASKNSESDSESENEKKRKFERVREKAKQTANNSGAKTQESNVQQPPAAEPSKNLDLLLDLDDIPPIGPVMTPSLGGFLTPGTPLAAPLTAAGVELVGPSFIEFKHTELVSKLSGRGLQVNYRFTRSPHLYSSAMVTIEFQFVNQSANEITSIEISGKALPATMNLKEFAPIAQLVPQQTATGVIGLDFNDSTQSIQLEITSSVGSSIINLKPPVGELIRSVHITEAYFKEERTKMRGMNEHQSKLPIKLHGMDSIKLKQKIYESMNVFHLATRETDLLYFVGQTMSSKSLVLIALDWTSSEGEQLLLTVNCEKMVIGSMILNELRQALNVAFPC